MKLAQVILVAEDNPDDVFFFKRAARQANVTSAIYEVSDGVEAIEYLRGDGRFADRARYPYPDVLFLDISMPRKSGFDVLEWARTASGELPIVVCMLSSSDQPKDTARAHQLGADFYTKKPPTPELFERLMDDCRLQWPRGK